MNLQSKRNLKEGSIIKHLLWLALPMAMAISANMSFNLIDTYFVSKLGDTPLAAISYSFPVVLCLLNFSIGIAIGTNSVLSRLIGEDKYEQVKSLSTIIVILALIVAVIIVSFGILTIAPLFKLIGATSEELPYIKDYMLYAYIAMGFRMVSIAVSGTYRAYGITLIPSLAIAITAIMNLILDPIFIFGLLGFPKMGIAGAGLSTCIANFCAFAFEFLAAHFKYNFFGKIKFNHSKLKLKEMLLITLPASLANTLNPLALNIYNYFLSQDSASKVAGLGIATRVQFFSMIPVLALSAAIGPIVGQNYGAKKQHRLQETLKILLIFSLMWGVIQFLILYFLATNLSSLFSSDQDIISYSSQYISLVSISLGGYSLVILSTSCLNAINKANLSFIIIFLRAIGLFLVTYYSLIMLNFKYPVIYAVIFSNFIAGIFAYNKTKDLIN